MDSTQYNCLVVDDEALAAKLLEQYITKIPQLKFVKTCHSAMEAQMELTNTPIDIMFLDIQMPDLTGLEFLKILPKKPLTILTTAYSEYAMDGYELDVADYLLKPIAFDRFFKAVSKVIQRLDASKKPIQTAAPVVEKSSDKKQEEEDRHSFFVKADSKIIQIAYDDVLFIESMREYACIYTTGKRIVTLQSLSKLVEILPTDKFFRIHRSYIVNISKVTSIQGNLVKVGDQQLTLSKGNREEFLGLINKDHLF